MPSPRSKVEVGPTGGRYYDLFMNVVSLGYYPRLIKRVVDKIDIQPGQSILDLGSGTGRNDCLKPGGIFYILDYNKFELEKLWFPLRWAFIHAECQLALEFLRLNLKKMLESQRFTSFEEELFLRGHLRLLKAAK